MASVLTTQQQGTFRELLQEVRADLRSKGRWDDARSITAILWRPGLFKKVLAEAENRATVYALAHTGAQQIGDGELFKWLVEWFSDGGWEILLEFVKGLIGLFSGQGVQTTLVHTSTPLDTFEALASNTETRLTAMLSASTTEPSLCTLPPDLDRHERDPVHPYSGAAATYPYYHITEDPWRKIHESGLDGRGEVIVNLDTGVRVDHADMKKVLGSRSWVGENPLRDGNGHGTHTAVTNCGNDPSVTFAPGASLAVGQVLSSGGSGGSDGIAAGIRWAATEFPGSIISMSLGGGGAYRPTLEAIIFAIERGCIVVASAGNAGFSGRNTIGYPGKFLESLAIGALQENGQRASFSSGGRELDWMLPGQNIVSADYRTQNGRRRMSGTSMSCPLAAALMAVTKQLQKREGAAHIDGPDAWRDLFAANMDDLGAPGQDDAYGRGAPIYDALVTRLQNNNLIFA